MIQVDRRWESNSIGFEESLHGRSGTVALPRVIVVVRGLVWLRARRVDRAVDVRKSTLAMMIQ